MNWENYKWLSTAPSIKVSPTRGQSFTASDKPAGLLSWTQSNPWVRRWQGPSTSAPWCPGNVAALLEPSSLTPASGCWRVWWTEPWLRRTTATPWWSKPPASPRPSAGPGGTRNPSAWQRCKAINASALGGSCVLGERLFLPAVYVPCGWWWQQLSVGP